MLTSISVVLQSQWYVCLHKRTAKFSSAKCSGVETVTQKLLRAGDHLTTITSNIPPHWYSQSR